MKPHVTDCVKVKPTTTATVRISTDLIARAEQLAERVADHPRFVSAFQILGKTPNPQDVIRHAVERGLDFIELQLRAS